MSLGCPQEITPALFAATRILVLVPAFIAVLATFVADFDGRPKTIRNIVYGMFLLEYLCLAVGTCALVAIATMSG